jgi:cbb3-type cytochrome oxidase maturation protein
MDSLYLLIPLSVLLVLAIAAILVWAVISGQFDRLDDAGARALREEPDAPEDHTDAASKPPANG